MNEPVDHRSWEELAAGYALDALDTTEVEAFGKHLDSCVDCQRSLAGFVAAAAELGGLAADESLTTPPWTAIAPGVVGGGRPVGSDARLPSPAATSARFTRARPLLLVVAAVGLLIAGGLVGGILGWRIAYLQEGSATPVDAGSCHESPACHVIALHDSQGASTAVLLVHQQRAVVVPMAMPAPGSGHTWVLWQEAKTGRTVLVASVGGTTDATQRSTVALPYRYAGTASFAVSVERVGATPAHPTEILALGIAVH